MGDKVVPRNVTPIIQAVRNILLGRKHIPERSALRYAPSLSARTQPQPILPDGEAHKLSANYYFTRDGRREVAPPQVLATGLTRKQITAGGESKPVLLHKKPVTPGKHWEWDKH